MHLNRSSHWSFEHPLHKSNSSYNLKSQWRRHLLKQQCWLLNIFELFKLGWGCTHSRLIRDGQKSYRSLKSMENFYVFLSTASLLSETLWQRALSAGSAHLQGTEIPVLSAGQRLLWGSSWAAGIRTRLNVLSCCQEMPTDAREGHAGSPEETALMRTSEHPQNIFKSYQTRIFSPKIFMLLHLQVEIYLLYFLVLDIHFSTEDVWAKYLKSRVVHNQKRKWLP